MFLLVEQLKQNEYESLLIPLALKNNFHSLVNKKRSKQHLHRLKILNISIKNGKYGNKN